MATSTGTRRRAYSWIGEAPPYQEKEAILEGIDASKALPIISQESRCVSAWVVTAAIIQTIVSILISVASYAYPVSKQHPLPPNGSYLWDGLFTGPSIVAGCLLRLVPRQVVTREAPGFIYASAW